LKNNNDNNFFEIGESLKKVRINQIVFPKHIRNEKTIKGIEKATLSFYKIEKILKAFDTIDSEISKNKKTENDQTKTKNFDIFLKLNKQSWNFKSK
jgi:hypothetical protein